MLLAAPAKPVALKMTGLPVDTDADAVTLLGPAAVPSVQVVSVAIPLAFEVTRAGLAGTIDPPPPLTANATVTPGTPFPLISLTLTDGGAATAVPTVAV